MKVVLKGQHCIEGASRRLYDTMVQKVVTGELQSDLVEDEIELLAAFLETVDFLSLRTRYPDLDGRRELEVEISQTAEGRFMLAWDDKRVVIDRKGR